MAYTTALDVANWFLARNATEMLEEADGITDLKLQKLLYYAQGSVLAITDKPLFDEPIEAWKHGPVVPAVYDVFKKYGGRTIDEWEKANIPQDVIGILESVFKVFGQYSAWKLRDMTHNETPWQQTAKSQVIPLKLIKDYFTENYVEA